MLRLTLRTLLAYLDDTLSPSESREIGQQIASEPALTELIARIKDVMRKRRLMADSYDADRAEVDPNDVAEYLDSVLSPARVIELEKRLLESDQDLAEVASVHQILSLVLVKPAEVTTQAKERAYRLIKSRTRSHSELAPVGHHKLAGGGPSSTNTTPLPLSMPNEVAPPHNKLLTGLAVSILSILLVVMIYFTLAPTPPTETSAPTAASPAAPLPANPLPMENGPAAAPPPPVAAPPQTPSPLPVEPLDPIPQDERSPLPAPPVPPIAPETNEETNPAPPAETPDSEAPAPPAAEEPSTADAILQRPARYVSPTGLLLARVEERWVRLQSQADALPGQRLANVSAECARLESGSGLTCELVELSRIELVSDPSADLALRLLEGRLILRTSNAPANVSLSMQGHSLKARLEPGAEVAIEKSVVSGPTTDQLAAPLVESLLIVVVQGMAHVSDGNDVKNLGAGHAITVTSSAALPEPMPAAAPGWLAADVDPSALRTAARLSDDISYGPDPQLQFQKSANDSSKAIHLAAVRALGAMDEVDFLVSGLSHRKYDQIRVECFHVLRHRLRAGGPLAERIQQALRDAYSEEPARQLEDLILGYSPSAQDNIEILHSVVDALESPELAIRQGAIIVLQELAERDLKFDPSAPAPQRDNAVDAWRRWLEQKEGARSP